MKTIKTLGLFFAVSLICGYVQAAVSISFSTGSSSLKNELNQNLAANSTFLVFWSSDASTSGFNNFDPLAPTGGDQLLGTYDTSPSGFPETAGRITGNLGITYGSGGDTYFPGYCYIAVFNVAYGSTISAGAYYGLGPISGALSDQYPTPGTPDNYGSLVTSAAPITTSLQVVPEPSSVALLLVGIGIVAARRFRRS